MRLRTYLALMAALSVGVPTLATAQTLTPAALAGVWTRTVPWKIPNSNYCGASDTLGTETDSLVLYPDSTFFFQAPLLCPKEAKSRWGRIGLYGCRGWFLSGDSLWFGPPAAPVKVQGSTVVVGYLPNKVTLRGQELSIQLPNPELKSPITYKRAGDAPPQAKNFCK